MLLPPQIFKPASPPVVVWSETPLLPKMFDRLIASTPDAEWLAVKPGMIVQSSVQIVWSVT